MMGFEIRRLLFVSLMSFRVGSAEASVRDVDSDFRCQRPLTG